MGRSTSEAYNEIHIDAAPSTVDADTASRIVLNRVSDPLVRARNVRSLRRLRRLAERR